MGAIRKQLDGITETEIDDEIVVMRLDNGEFFALSGTAAAAWRLIDGNRDRRALLAALASEYGTNEQQVNLTSMSSSSNSISRVSLPAARLWLGRFKTATGMLALSIARLAVAFVAFERWRGTLGSTAGARGSMPTSKAAAEDARRVARIVERAAQRLPFDTKCLPRAMALSWLLRRKAIGDSVVFAVRPTDLRNSTDVLHAWVEIDGSKIIGDLPGSWRETLRRGS